tara:strand:- start:239 stop:886 length:648 start_codon:yes stop_codon:yes gene_type:complete
MQNALKTSLVTTSQKSNNVPVKQVEGFNVNSFDTNNPAEAINSYTYIGKPTFINVNGTLPTFDKLLALIPYKNNTQGMLATLLLTGVCTATATTKTAPNGKPIYSIALNTGKPIAYNNGVTKQVGNVGAILKNLMGQGYGNKGKSHNALISLMFGIASNGYNVISKNVKLNQLKPLVTLTTNKPANGVTHSTEVINTYKTEVNNLINKYPNLIQG